MTWLDTASTFSHHTNEQKSSATEIWTAERCCKLLKQLDLRLTALRKLAATRSQGVPTRRAQQHMTRGLDDYDDRPTKRIRYTYSTTRRQQVDKKSTQRPQNSELKSKTCSTTNLTAAESAGSEPVLSDDPVTSGSDFAFSNKGTASQAQDLVELPHADLLENLQSLRGNDIPHERFRHFRANFEWLAGVLQSTQESPSNVRSKSLLSMCLRKVPACIGDIEAWEASESSTTTKYEAALDIYRQLEAFAHHGQGWEPLKQTIRSHVMVKLTKAISELLFPPGYVALLVRLCVRLNCASEASGLVLASATALPRPNSWKSDFIENRSLAPLHALIHETSLDDREKDYQRVHVYECVSRLLREKRLPTTWVSTRGLGAILSTCLESVAMGRARPQTLAFLVTIIESLYQGHNGTSQNSMNRRSLDGRRLQTLIKAVSSLTAVGVLCGQAENGETCLRTEPPQQVVRTILHVLDWSVTRCFGRGEPGHDSDLIILVLARFLVVSGRDGVNENLIKLQTQTEVDELLHKIQGEDARSQLALYRKVVVLICAISQRSNGGLGAHEDLFSSLCQRLDELELPSWLRQGLVCDGPFLVRHRDADLHALAHSRTQMPTTSPRNTLASDWRWEESISEWVLPTTRTTTTSQSFTVPTTCHAHASDRTARARSQARILARKTDKETSKATGRPVVVRRTIVDKPAQGSRDSGRVCSKEGGNIDVYRVPVNTKDAMAGVEINMAACRGLSNDETPQRQQSTTKVPASQPFDVCDKENEDPAYMSKNDINSKAMTVLEARRASKDYTTRDSASASMKHMNKQKALLLVEEDSARGKRPLQNKRLRRSVGSLIGHIQRAVPCDLEADWADVC